MNNPKWTNSVSAQQHKMKRQVMLLPTGNDQSQHDAHIRKGVKRKIRQKNRLEICPWAECSRNRLNRWVQNLQEIKQSYSVRTNNSVERAYQLCAELRVMCSGKGRVSSKRHYSRASSIGQKIFHAVQNTPISIYECRRICWVWLILYTE
jgi:hypothetical protein